MRPAFRTLLASLPVLAAMAFAPHGALAQNKPTKPTPALQKEYDSFIAAFRAALKANDAAAVTSMTRMPFSHDNGRIDAAEFRAKAYPYYFTPRHRACIQTVKGVYDVDGLNQHNFVIVCSDETMFIFTKMENGFKFTTAGEAD